MQGLRPVVIPKRFSWLKNFNAMPLPINVQYGGDPEVLVVVVYTDYKAYCEWLVWKNYEALTYYAKSLLYVDEQICPALREGKTGEEVALIGREYGVQYARKHHFDYILFLDADLQCPPDTIERLMATHAPLAAGATAARGDAKFFIGHNYRNRENLERRAILESEAHGIKHVDGVGGCCLLVRDMIFEAVDYSGYTGHEVIPGRFTGDDEWYQIKVWRQFRIRPVVDFELRPWHFNDDGWAYRLWGQKKYWQTGEEKLLNF